MNYELNFENDKPQISFENTTNNIQFQAPQNVVGGTTNYKALSNKPKINGVELVDNKTLEELGIKQEYTASDIKFADGDTFQDKYNSGELKGETGATGPQGVQGPNGKDGKTPVKGVDYYTEADKLEMVDLVLSALPNSEGVSY